MKQLLAILLIATTAQADFEYLKPGDAVPYAGYLITPEREQKFRLMDQQLQIDLQLIKQYDVTLKITNEQLNLSMERLSVSHQENERLSKEIVEARGDGFWNKFLYFALGALVTTGIVYGVSRVTN